MQKFSVRRRIQPSPPVCKGVKRPGFDPAPWPGRIIQAWVQMIVPGVPGGFAYTGVVPLNWNEPLSQWNRLGLPVPPYTLQVRTGHGMDPALWDFTLQIFSGGGPLVLAYKFGIPVNPTQPLYTPIVTLDVQIYTGEARMRVLS